jgi:hypothetical protein
MDKTYNTAKATMKKSELWIEMKKICQSAGRKILMKDAIHEACQLWIEKNKDVNND